MIIISKKRILIITLCVCIGIFTFSISNLKNKSTIETVALPVNNKVVVLDAGHGKPDERSTIKQWNNRS